MSCAMRAFLEKLVRFRLSCGVAAVSVYLVAHARERLSQCEAEAGLDRHCTVGGAYLVLGAEIDAFSPVLLMFDRACLGKGFLS